MVSTCHAEDSKVFDNSTSGTGQVSQHLCITLRSNSFGRLNERSEIDKAERRFRYARNVTLDRASLAHFTLLVVMSERRVGAIKMTIVEDFNFLWAFLLKYSGNNKNALIIAE